MPSSLNIFCQLNARPRLFISLIVGVVCFFIMPQQWVMALRLISSWDIAVGFFLLLTWILISHTTAEETKRLIDQQDQSGTAILLLVIIAACASLFAIGVLTNHGKQATPLYAILYAVLSGIAVLCSWLFIHAMFAFHYTHHYYRKANTIDSKSQQDPGLVFPHERKPDYFDFAYFSLVIGMTSQVSDVQITSRFMRRLVMLHSFLSFMFNVAILAVAVNIISGLIS
jgi:uncharacterized membrane protein